MYGSFCRSFKTLFTAVISRVTKRAQIIREQIESNLITNNFLLETRTTC